LIDETDDEIIQFLTIFKNKIQNESFDREVDAVYVAKKTFIEINEECRVYREIEDRKCNWIYLPQDEFNGCQNYVKELILYKCIDRDQRDIYFDKKKIKSKFRKSMDEIYESLEKKCSRELYDRITKKKLEPVIWEIRKKHGDDIIFACGDQKKKMDFILSLLQKISL
jgi:hypothetical protein